MQSKATKTTYSTREVADLVGSQTWRVRRLFEDGTLAEPGRFAGKRAIPAKLIPIIVEALRNREWLNTLPPVVREILAADTAPETLPPLTSTEGSMANETGL